MRSPEELMKVAEDRAEELRLAEVVRNADVVRTLTKVFEREAVDAMMAGRREFVLSGSDLQHFLEGELGLNKDFVALKTLIRDLVTSHGYQFHSAPGFDTFNVRW